MSKSANVIIAVLLLAVATVSAAETSKKDVPAEKMTVTVVSVTGQAEKLVPGEKSKWVALTGGDKLDELSVIRTGLRSKVVLKFADRGQTTVQAGTKVGVGEFSKKGKLVTTRLGLKYGSLNVSVDSTRGPNDAQVATPVATLSVRGTSGQIGYTGGRQVRLRGQSGTWHVASGGRSRNVGAGESTDGNLTPSINLTQLNRDSFRAVLGLTQQERSSIVDRPRPLQPTGTGDSTPTNTDSTTPEPESPDNHIILGGM